LTRAAHRFNSHRNEAKVLIEELFSHKSSIWEMYERARKLPWISRIGLDKTPVSDSYGSQGLTGQLALKPEAAGKVRVFAIVDP